LLLRQALDLSGQHACLKQLTGSTAFDGGSRIRSTY